MQDDNGSVFLDKVHLMMKLRIHLVQQQHNMRDFHYVILLKKLEGFLFKEENKDYKYCLNTRQARFFGSKFRINSCGKCRGGGVKSRKKESCLPLSLNFLLNY